MLRMRIGFSFIFYFERETTKWLACALRSVDRIVLNEAVTKIFYRTHDV